MKTFVMILTALLLTTAVFAKPKSDFTENIAVDPAYNLTLVPMASPHPTPPMPPPEPVICNTNCEAFEPDYPSTCAAPDISHKRQCTTYCSNGGYNHWMTERLCLPAAGYVPVHFDNHWGSSFNVQEDERFKSTQACDGQWWVHILSNVQYFGNQLSIMSNAWKECQK